MKEATSATPTSATASLPSGRRCSISPEYNLGYHFRFWQEFGAVDRPEGVIATLTVVKPF
jgi:hypothetical protein